jgi:cytochrome c5
MRFIDCYYFIDGTSEDENGFDPDATIRAMCHDCHRGRPSGWPYRGETGEWDTVCAGCGRVIPTRPAAPPQTGPQPRPASAG